MLPKSNSSLVPSPNTTDKNFYNRTLLPTDSLLNSHYKSAPNVAFYFDDQVCMNIIYFHLKL
jgi:hypothetical protein